MGPTKVVAAHLCVELELGEGIAVAAGGLEEPIADRLLRQLFGSGSAHSNDAIWVAFGDWPMLAQTTRLQATKQEGTIQRLQGLT